MKPMRHTRLAIAAATAAALVLAGCGSSNDAATTPGAGTTAPTSAAAPSSGASSAPTAAESTEAQSGESSTAAPAGSGEKLPAAQLKLLFGSSGKAETDALNAAAKAWSADSGSTVEVTPAQDLTQQLAQGFAAGNAPDLFYVGADQLANYAKAGNLLAYGDELSNKADFYPALTSSFTYDGKLYCAPKDMSTLGLIINTDLWAKAGLTDADIPTNWDQLAAVSKKLTTGDTVGLTIAPERDRLNAFMVQNGSFLVADDGTTLTANDQKNVDALAFVKKLIDEGSVKFPSQLDSGWAGEAFGKGKAVMTIEGNWIVGFLKNDYPAIKYKAVELPAGPAGDKGTLVFTNCWGISATTKAPEQAKAFVEFLTSTDQQLEFANAFGVIPSVESAKAAYTEKFPANEAFVAGVEYARGVVNLPGITDVMADFNSQLQGLATADPKAILDSVQENLTDAIGG